MMHHFDVGHAEKYGIKEAIFIDHLQWWIRKNIANQKHQHDGRTWTYNSHAAFAEMFPYLTIDQVRRTLESLVDQGVIMKGNYNKMPYDQTKWYAFVDESICGISRIDLANLPDRNDKNARPIPADKPDSKPSKEGKNGFLFVVESETLPPPLNTEDVMTAWDMWQHYKVESGQKLTPMSAHKQIAKMKSWGPARAVAAIQNSIEQGYTGLYEPQASRDRPTKQKEEWSEDIAMRERILKRTEEREREMYGSNTT